MSKAEKWAIDLFFKMQASGYQLSKAMLTSAAGKGSELIITTPNCKVMPFLQEVPDSGPDPENCVEIWTYTTQFPCVSLGNVISCGYPHGGETPTDQNVIVRLFVSIYKSGNGAGEDSSEDYDTLALTGIAWYPLDSGLINLEPVGDCQDIPAGDPVKCVKVWMSSKSASPGSVPDETEQSHSGPVVDLSLGGIQYYYPRR